MELREYLSSYREDLPEWLDQFKPGDPFLRKEFFQSRVVYYPGPGIDGHPVALFGSTHSAHCFVYPDYFLTQDQIIQNLEHSMGRFRGCNNLARLNLTEHDITPSGWKPHLLPRNLPRDPYQDTANAPYAFLEILERANDLDDKHGARRLAILFLGADGIATYDALFCQQCGNPPPYAVIVQDHGSNRDHFGRGGLLERLARQCDVFPSWQLVATGAATEAWHGFHQVQDVAGESGGMQRQLRFLFEAETHQTK